MSVARRSPPAARTGAPEAPVFAALGDETRLSLVARLSGGSPLSITRLTEGAEVTRQAIRKHLRVLEGAGLVRGARQGREILFRLEPEPLEEAMRYLELVSAQWDRALARLKSFVEAPADRGGARPGRRGIASRRTKQARRARRPGA